MDDAGLLQAFIDKRAEPAGQEAFRALVDRHLNMVYAVCRRQLRDEHWAEDVAQAVFILLSKKAAELPPKTVLGGWLYKTAVYACSNARQLQRTRSYHESRVKPMNDDETDNPVERAETEGLLDEALMGLSEAQREVLVLRFFENKPLTEIARLRGDTLYATEKAHQTGLEKLRKFLARRGVTTTAAILIAVMAGQSAQAAPAGLATACTAAAVGGASTSVSVTALVARMINQWVRMKFFAGASLAAGCAMLVTTLVTAAALSPLGHAHPVNAPPAAAAAPAPGLSPAQEAAEIAALGETLRQVEASLRTMDHEALAGVVTFTNLRQAKHWDAMARVFEADLRLKQVAAAKFGPQAGALTAIPTFGERLDEVLPQVLPESCRWRVTPRAAVLHFAYRDGTRAGGSLYFVRDSAELLPVAGGGWKLDAGRSLDIVLEGLSGVGNRRALDALTDAEQEATLARIERLERGFREVGAAIETGAIGEIAAARAELEQKTGESPPQASGGSRAFFHIALKFDEIEQARSVQ
jgi:RNA polymerase sigma factor (sigma-70 family)